MSGQAESLLDEFQTRLSSRRDSELNVAPTFSAARLSINCDRPQSVDTADLPRSLTYSNGLALVVGLQIGSGIFSSPSAVINQVGLPGVAIFVWLLAGLLAWTGAASFAELGSIVPLNGGIQEYMRYCYHDICGFLAAWAWILVLKPCSMAMASLIFSEYVYRIFSLHENLSTWILKATALLAVVLITSLNCMGTRIIAGTANVFLVLKIIGLGSIIVTGLTLGITRYKERDDAQGTNVRESSWFTVEHPGNAEQMRSGLWAHLGNYADATFAALWAYGGWETVSLSPYHVEPC